MEGVASILILAGMVIFVLGIVAFFKPMPKLRLGTRKAASVALALSVGSCVAGGALMPPDPNAAKAPAAKSEAAAPAGVKEAEVRELWQKVLGGVEPCDAAGKQVQELTAEIQAGRSRADMVDVYQQLADAKDACMGSYMALTSLNPPRSAKGDHKKAFGDALDRCQKSAMYRKIAFESMAKYADGDQRPSIIASARDDMNTAQTASMLCVANFMDAASKAGVSAEVFKPAS